MKKKLKIYSTINRKKEEELIMLTIRSKKGYSNGDYSTQVGKLGYLVALK